MRCFGSITSRSAVISPISGSGGSGIVGGSVNDGPPPLTVLLSEPQNLARQVSTAGQLHGLLFSTHMISGCLATGARSSTRSPGPM